MPYYRIYGGVPREISTWENFAGKDYITVVEVTAAELPFLGAPAEGESYALCEGEPLAWDAATSTWKNFFTQLSIPVNTGPAGPAGVDGTNGTNGTNGANNVLSIGTVSTLAAGTSATVSITGISPAQTLNLGIPAGAAGINGTNGTNGTNATVTGYQNTTLKTAILAAYKSAVVASGVAVFQLTVDGLSTGTAIFPNEVFGESIQLIVNDATASYQFGWVLTNSNKTLTVTTNKLGTANILTGILGQVAAPNGTVVNLTIKGR